MMVDVRGFYDSTDLIVPTCSLTHTHTQIYLNLGIVVQSKYKIYGEI